MIPANRSPNGYLARARTTDDIELEGFVVEALDVKTAPTTLVHVHGMFENFHMPAFVDEMLSRVSETGMTMVAVNTRAQDYTHYHRHWSDGSYTWKRNGGSYEIFSNCLPDLDGWIDYCHTQIGAKRIILSGHSHGALKVAYYAAKRQNARIDGLILMSPSDDIEMQEAALGERYDEALELASSLIAAGNGEEFVPDWMYSSPISAEMYRDMFGTQSDLNIFRLRRPESSSGLAASVNIPTLLLYGEHDIATAGLPSAEAAAACRSLLGEKADVTTAVVAGADHQYLNHEEELVALVTGWAARHVDKS
ncbi:alpha/beta hydrolase family protein [Mangrovihabitans endophyticus]|uniref:Lysophospholipase, alpha-beta hydrolase superfamily n=1 Tax=Mangrovihabitans endophyticus TaxID=1751298 RepID=A0A8J3BVQ1_9ACTN|nr:alpha/beta hydrolase [Mangrovihabitans endophyticus]GGK73691.1 hypothetical protein GCM10012284_04480 [Mangrovihabitans endophyticus]